MLSQARRLQTVLTLPAGKDMTFAENVGFSISQVFLNENPGGGVLDISSGGEVRAGPSHPDLV